jgi:hypothetical protein
MCLYNPKMRRILLGLLFVGLLVIAIWQISLTASDLEAGSDSAETFISSEEPSSSDESKVSPVTLGLNTSTPDPAAVYSTGNILVDEGAGDGSIPCEPWPWCEYGASTGD